MGATGTTVVLPARSVAVRAVTRIVWLAPSEVKCTAPGHEAMPDSASEHVKPTTTSSSYQPLTFTLFVVAVATGGVLSIESLIVPVAQFALASHTEGLVKSDTFLVWEDPAFYVWGIVFALVIGVIASLIPAWRGSKVEPVDVLRGQIG